MRFGPVPLVEAGGAVLAHSVALPGLRLDKGHVLTDADLAALARAGAVEVTVARLCPGDVAEDAAAARLAAALLPDAAAAGLTATPAHAGRVNLKAAGPGLFTLDADAVHALNAVDPGIGLATLAPFARVAAGGLVATMKIMPYAVPETAVAAAEALARRARPRLVPVRRGSAGLLLTEVPGQNPKLNAKGLRAVEARLTALGMVLAGSETVVHEAPAIAAALARLPGEMLLILTGSATSDIEDDAPRAVRQAGGRVTRFGMPVDPGNLLFLGDLGGRPVLGLPGCARSPALNGADWVLERLACGLEVTGADIAAMGVGGLLKESPARPQPREGRRAP